MNVSDVSQRVKWECKRLFSILQKWVAEHNILVVQESTNVEWFGQIFHWSKQKKKEEKEKDEILSYLEIAFFMKSSSVNKSWCITLW